MIIIFYLLSNLIISCIIYMNRSIKFNCQIKNIKHWFSYRRKNKFWQKTDKTSKNLNCDSLKVPSKAEIKVEENEKIVEQNQNPQNLMGFEKMVWMIYFFNREWNHFFSDQLN